MQHIVFLNFLVNRVFPGATNDTVKQYYVPPAQAQPFPVLILLRKKTAYQTVPVAHGRTPGIMPASPG